MIDIQVIASSSSGNCYRLTSGKHQLLLEAGVSIQQIKKACGYQLGWIDACLISHAHADHSQSAAQLIKAGVDVYMSAETARALGEKAVGATVLIEDKAIRLGRNYWTVKTFPLYHDAPCIGFLIYDNEDSVVFATDTFAVPKLPVNAIGQLMIECNYMPDILDQRLEAGHVNFKQAERILHSHMSLDSVLMFLRHNQEAMRYCRRIYLLHGSRDNGDSNQFKLAVQRATGKEVVVCEP